MGEELLGIHICAGHNPPANTGYGGKRRYALHQGFGLEPDLSCLVSAAMDR